MDGPLVQFEQILKRASEKKASDIHLKNGLPPIIRVNGGLFYLSDEAGEIIPRLSHFQLTQMCQHLMNERQKIRYEGGEEIDLAHEILGLGRFRINICQQRSFPRLSCRLIPEQIRTLSELGIPLVVEDLVFAERGLVLIGGATGSGKSTTLAAMIDHIARNTSSHIITLEDPIEYIFKDRKSIITQREVGIDTKNFPQALKYALRQDPDVILVGEMRDEETILMALSAAETGHLVLSTLHANDASDSINRILGCVSMGNREQVRVQLASILLGVVSQRLVSLADGTGRIPAVEILIANKRVKEMILDPKRTVDLPKAITESANLGMQTFDQGLLKLLGAKRITTEEAFKHCTNIRDFQLKLEGVVAGIEPEKDTEEVLSRSQKIEQALKGKKNPPQLIELDLNDKKKK